MLNVTVTVEGGVVTDVTVTEDGQAVQFELEVRDLDDDEEDSAYFDQQMDDGT